MATPDIVAIFNSSPDTVDMLREVLQHAGITAVSAFTFEIRDGQVDLEAFIRQHRPAAILYDVAPPYEANWRLYQHLRATPALAHCQFVVTSTNGEHVRQLAGRDERIYEIVGKPYDLGEIVQAVKEALRARPTR